MNLSSANADLLGCPSRTCQCSFTLFPVSTSMSNIDPATLTEDSAETHCFRSEVIFHRMEVDGDLSSQQTNTSGVASGQQPANTSVGDPDIQQVVN